jgi:hypothetical protein
VCFAVTANYVVASTACAWSVDTSGVIRAESPADSSVCCLWDLRVYFFARNSQAGVGDLPSGSEATISSTADKGFRYGWLVCRLYCDYLQGWLV